MKIYTHPIIKLPAGNVDVKFYDKNKSGSETLPDCIIDIGDVEEGFDYNFGEYNAPTCDFKIWNKDNIIKNMFDTNELKVAVNVNNENYFYGFIDLESVKPSDNFFFEYSFTAYHLITGLQFYLMEKFNTDRASFYNNDKWRIKTLIKLMATFIGLDSTIIYNLSTKYKTLNKYEKTLEELIILPDTWNLDNAYELLKLLRIDFQFNFYITYENGLARLKLHEGSNIELNEIKSVAKYKKYTMKQLIVQLANIPDGMSYGSLYYISKTNNIFYGDNVTIDMKHTNIKRALGTITAQTGILNNIASEIHVYSTDLFPENGNAKLVSTVFNEETIFSYTGKTETSFLGCITQNSLPYAINDQVLIFTNGAEVLANNRIYLSELEFSGEQLVNTITSTAGIFISLQEAVYRKIKDNYYENTNWKIFRTYGINASKSNLKKLDYLMPGNTFTNQGNSYLIHTVKKSLKRNESEVVSLMV